MPCTDCFNGCDDELSSDKCIKYTGDDVSSIGICEGDSLRIVLDDIIAELVKHKTGDGITVDDLSACNSIISSLGTSSPTIENLLRVLTTSYCSLKASIISLQSSGGNFSFDKKCISAITSSSTREQVIQAVINKLCTIDSSVTTILNDYVKSSELNTLIKNYLDVINTTVIVNNYAKMVPYVAYEYYGPLSNFDSTGKGIASTGYDNVYICNGSNGTPDKRGRVAVGATLGIPGGAFDSAVDPALNAGYQIGMKQKIGSFTNTLDITEVPSHTHKITDPGHSHNLSVLKGGSGSGNLRQFWAAQLYEDFGAQKTDVATSGVSLDSTGGGQPHNNVQPSIGACYIIYIP